MAWRRRRVQETQVNRVASWISDPVSRLRFLRRTARAQGFWRGRRRVRLRAWVLSVGVVLATAIPLVIRLAAGKPDPPPLSRAASRPEQLPQGFQAASVWQVEQSADSEVYSNGLRIDTRYAVPNRPRFYLAFPRDSIHARRGMLRSQPAGIVYHTTESCQAPFDAENTPALKRLGRSLLDYVRSQRAYHYVIDRFGRVYRVVAESDAAYHAGHSVWADDQWFYLDLNNGFLGISFEAQTIPDQPGGGVSPAQVRAAAVLTEMLRSRYQIPAGNCVTHAQVSVNPSNMLVGYHTDWAAGFPFTAIGLPDNYQRALPAVWAFGFEFEPVRLSTGGISRGIELAEQNFAHRAAAAGMRPAAYRKTLRGQYREWEAEARQMNLPRSQPRSGSAGL